MRQQDSVTVPVSVSANYDEQLRSLADYGCELRNGFTNHTPMVIEALRRLGRVDAISEWLDSARPRVCKRPPLVNRIQRVDDLDGSDALGEPDRFSDWAEFFLEQIESDGWQPTASEWTSRLIDGFTSAALHGAIRVGHAVRALGDTDTQVRRRELADALAGWASAYQPFPIPAASRAQRAAPNRVLMDMPYVPTEHRRNDGSIVAAIGQLTHADGFAEAIGGAQFDADPVAALLELASLFAGVFAREVHSPLTAVVFTHAVTGAAAAQHLARIVSRDVADQLVWQAWRSGCALIATYADASRRAQPLTPAAQMLSPVELIDAAIETADDHAIKLTEAALWFYEQNTDPVFLRAALLCSQVVNSPD